jgi:ubiquinone/menaquinone biosynthesis C-methylase UbiE
MKPQEQIMEEARLYFKSRVILTAAELDVFTALDEAPASASRLSGITGADVRSLTRLLDCATALGLLEKDGELYRLTEASRFLSAKHPGSVLPMVLHMNTIWDNWSRLTECVRAGTNRALKPVVNAMTDEERKSFIGAMHVAGRKLSQEIARAFDLTGFKKLIDIGGGSGTYAIAFLEQAPHLQAVVFDFESVIEMARERLGDEGLLDRVELAAGDFYEDKIPEGCDLALLSAIVHQNSPDENVALYRKIHEALEPGGALLIRDHVMDETRTRPPAGAVFALNMLVNTPAGDTYTFAEMKETLEKAGFERVKQIKSGERMDSLVVAHKR